MINRHDVWNFPRCSKADQFHERDGVDKLHLFAADSRTHVDQLSEDEFVLYDHEQALLIRVFSYPVRLLFTILSLMAVFGVVIVHAEDDVKGYLRIDSIDLYEAIYDAPMTCDNTCYWDESYWNNNVAHLNGPGMFWVDQGTRTVLVAHNPGLFELLPDVQVGDMVVVRTEDYTYRYKVQTKWITTVNDVSPVQPTSDARLTLITCYGTERLVIDAVRIK